MSQPHSRYDIYGPDAGEVYPREFKLPQAELGVRPQGWGLQECLCKNEGFVVHFYVSTGNR